MLSHIFEGIFQGQLMTHTRKEVIYTATQLYKLQQESSHTIQFYRALNKNSALVSMAPTPETVQNYPLGNTLICAQTTAIGRVMLNKLLYTLEENKWVVGYT